MNIYSLDYDDAKFVVLRYLLDESTQKIYVEAWNGVGATALLGELASKKLKFDTVIKVVRPSPFQNRREIQRAVVKQLNLPPSVTASLDAADEDDDFRGKELSSRDPLSRVTEEIYTAVKDRRVLLVLCNNIAHGMSIYPSELGIPIVRLGSRNVVLWTSGMNISSEAALINADWIVGILPPDEAAALDLVYLEAIEIARYIDESSSGSLRTNPQIVLRCF